jgi:hypothetical protein
MPISWVADDSTWQKAKKAVMKHKADYDEPYAVVAHVYQQMGGKVKGEAKPAECSAKDMQAWKGHEATALSANAALARPGAGEAKKGWTFQPLREAALDSSGKRIIKCILITEGPGNKVDKRYYTRQFIEDAAKKYEGARAFLNHQTEAEARERSEGDIKDQCGYYRGLNVQPTVDPETGKTVMGVFGDLHVDESAAGDEAWSKAQAQMQYLQEFPTSADVYVGLSINGAGIPNGTMMIEGQQWTQMVGVGSADSVDVVTRPARGGRFLALSESVKEELDMNKKLLKLIAKIGESNKKLGAEKDASRKALLEAELVDLQAQLAREAEKAPPVPPKAAEDEAEAKGEAEEAEDEDGGDDDGDDGDGDGKYDGPPMADMKKKIPKQPDETDDEHESRIKDIHASMTAKGEDEAGGKGKESVRGMSAKQLRAKHPALFQAVAESVRKNLGAQASDVPVLKARVRELESQLQESRVKERVLDDTQEAKQLLAEAKLPTKFVSVQDLIGLTKEEKRRKISQVQAILEAATGGSFGNREAGARGPAGSSDLDGAIDKLIGDDN